MTSNEQKMMDTLKSVSKIIKMNRHTCKRVVKFEHKWDYIKVCNDSNEDKKIFNVEKRE